MDTLLQTEWSDFTNHKDLDCWMKFYLVSALKKTVNTLLKINYGYFTINNVRRL